MVEWFKATVLKTVEVYASEGSNPSPSAITRLAQLVRAFPLHGKGQRFESVIWYHFLIIILIIYNTSNWIRSSVVSSS